VDMEDVQDLDIETMGRGKRRKYAKEVEPSDSPEAEAEVLPNFLLTFWYHLLSEAINLENLQSWLQCSSLVMHAAVSEGWTLKIEIHEIQQNLRNPVSTNRNPLPTTKSNSAE